MRRRTWSANWWRRSRTKAASNSSYRYMAVLTEWLAGEHRGGRPLGADALADAVGDDPAVHDLHGLGLEAEDARRRLGSGNGRLLGVLVLLPDIPSMLQVLYHPYIAAHIVRRARKQ